MGDIMPNKLTIEEVRDRVLEYEYELLSKEYFGSKSTISVRHIPCGKIYEMSFESFYSKKGCIYCSGNERKTVEYVRDFAKDLGFSLLSLEYESSQSKLEFKHDFCGHLFIRSWAGFRKSKKCPKCEKKVKLNLNDCKNITEEMGYILLSKKYKNGKDILKFKHLKCNTIFKYTITAMQKYGCPICAKEIKNKKRNKTLLENRGSLMDNFPDVAKTWSSLNSKTPKDVLSSTGEDAWWTCNIEDHPDYLMKISKRTNSINPIGCPICGELKRKKNKRETDMKKSMSVSEFRPDLISEWSINNINPPEYYSYGSHEKVLWICDLHGEYLSSIKGRTTRNSGCLECGKIKQQSSSISNKINNTGISFKTFRPDLSDEWSEINEKLPENFLPKSNKYAWWKCSIHGDYYCKISDRVLKNTGCPLCSVSSGEKRILYFLESIGLTINKNLFLEKKFKDCKNKNPLPFDFYIPILNLLIEYDGQQHFKEVRFGGMSSGEAKKNFVEQKKRDKIKNKFCKKEGYNLLRISYLEFNNIELILEKTLKNLLIIE